MPVEKSKIIQICETLGGKLMFMDKRRPAQKAKAMVNSSDYAQGFLAGLAMALHSPDMPELIDDDRLNDDLAKRFEHMIYTFGLTNKNSRRYN